MTIAFHALPTETVAAIRDTGIDAYGNPVERHHAAGGTWPCRHCLGQTSDDYLILAHRPFDEVNPFAETGPIFLCADKCAWHVENAEVPAALNSPAYIICAYMADERILYGTGKVTPTGEIAACAESLLRDPDVAFVDAQSAANNCYQCRIKRA